ncbi:MAG: hypothetical protein L3J67_04370 [Hyphomicrobiaceae bacterium]|nr:hypothetical protein [Hyphomicrobiaceae bacterium]
MPIKRLIFFTRSAVQAALLTLVIILGTPVASALSEEINSLRIGGDYDIKTLRVGADFRECRRACQKDVSCKAWTFIKERVRKRKGINFNLGPDLNIGFGGKREVIPAQCRLKHSVGPKHANDCCVSGVKRVVVSRRPRKAELCATYAEKALEQQDENLSQQCRFRGTRWDSSYRGHYRWCMKSATRRSNRETRARDADLRDCRDNSSRKVRRNSSCDRYASTAMDILEQAKNNDCRSANRDWDREYERVYEWCVDHRPEERRRTLENAQAKLSSCIRRGGGPLNERCESYAEGALTQVKRANDNECRVSGTTWSDNFKTHYKACRKFSRREIRRKNDQRENFVNRCIRRGSQPRIMETGSVEVRQRNARQWHSVRFTKRFKDPVVIMGPVSFNGGQPAHARVRRVTSRGFEFRIEEFGEDGRHVKESLSYMVVEKGVHQLSKGGVIEAGTILTGADLVKRAWSRVNLSSSWRKAPVVLAQTQTFKGSDPVNARIKNVSRQNFEVTLSEQESDRDGHTREIVAYVAITQGASQVEGEANGNAVMWTGRASRASSKWRRVAFGSRFRNSAPALFATAQSSNGADTFDVRYRGLSRRDVNLRLQEEQSRDRETNHTNEVLGVVALPYGKYWASSSSRVYDQVARDPVAAPLPPVIEEGSLRNCRDYAEQAVVQYRRSIRGSCAFSGRTWHTNERRHMRWCRRNGLGAADDELQSHKGRLRRCLARVDEAPVEPGAIALDWRRIDGALKHVSVGADGTVWGVQKQGKVWARRGNKWRAVRGRVKQLDVGTAREIWSVGNNDRVYRWDGRKWRTIKGRLKQISVGANGTVWGVNARNRVYKYNGSGWTNIRGRLKQVSVGNRRHIWGVNSANSVFRWKAPGWQKMPGKMKQVSVASNGDVYGLSARNKVFKWSKRRNDWIGVKGTLRQLSVGNGSEIWGVNRLDRIYRARIVASADPYIPPHGHDAAPVAVGAWVALGCGKVGRRRKTDVISVGRGKGRFSAIKLKVSRNKVKLARVRVTFGNGQTQDLSIPGKVSKNTSSGPHDLNGNRRFISNISIDYRATASFPPRRSVVCLFVQN